MSVLSFLQRCLGFQPHQECIKCGQVKPLTQFYKERKNGSIRRSTCKACICAYVRERDRALRSRRKRYVAQTNTCEYCLQSFIPTRNRQRFCSSRCAGKYNYNAGKILTGIRRVTDSVRKTKYCYKCKTDVALTNFSSDRSKPDGLHTRCKDCDREYQRERLARVGDVKTTANTSDETPSTINRAAKAVQATATVPVTVFWHQGAWTLVVERCPACGLRHYHGGGENQRRIELGIRQCLNNPDQQYVVALSEPISLEKSNV